jgi:hypothetical protein
MRSEPRPGAALASAVPCQRRPETGLGAIENEKVRKTGLASDVEFHSAASVEEMETKYREGTLGEADSWQDFQRLDHLGYKRDRLTRLLQEKE